MMAIKVPDLLRFPFMEERTENIENIKAPLLLQFGTR
jgi:hypothetical protein